MDDLLLLASETIVTGAFSSAFGSGFDGGTFNPGDVLSVVGIWLKADAGAGVSDSDPVATWSDQSGKSHNFTQGTSGKRPLYRTNKRLGMPAIVFDGTDDELDGGDLSAVFTSGASVFAAVNGLSGVGRLQVYDHANIDDWWVHDGGQGFWGPFRSARLATTPSSGLQNLGWHLWSMTADNGSNYKVWEDGVNKINDTGGFTFQGGTSHNIGHQRTAAEYPAMELGELIVCNVAVSDTLRQQFETYLDQRWGVLTGRPDAVAGVGAVPSPSPFSAEAYQGLVHRDGALGYWRLGETSGTVAADDTGNGRTGTYTNGPTLNQASLVGGTSNPAVSFDGSNDYVNLSNPAALRLFSAWTLEAWIKVAAGETIFGAVIAQSYDGSRVPLMLGSFDGGSNHTMKPSAGFYNGSWRLAKSASSILADTVHHLVGTWDGTTIRIYVDGTEAANNTPGSSPTQNTQDIYIGSRWDNSGDGQKFKGVIDDVAIYGYALSSTQVADHYAAGLATSSAFPAVVTGNGAVSNATGKGNATATPSTTAGTGAVPAPTAMGGGLATSAAVAGIGSVPAPTVFSIAAGTAPPQVVAGVGAVPASTVTGQAAATPSATTGIGAVPAPTATGTSTATPATISGVATVPAPTIAVSALTSPPTVAGVGRVPHPYVVGEGTGGGGGSPNGATDFWTVKLGV